MQVSSSMQSSTGPRIAPCGSRGLVPFVQAAVAHVHAPGRSRQGANNHDMALVHKDASARLCNSRQDGSMHSAKARMRTCLRAGRASAATAAVPSPLPASQQQAVQEAVQCVCVRMKPRLTATKGSSKGFAAPASTTKETLHIEIPTADQEPASIAQLGVDTAAHLASTLGNCALPLVLVCASPAAAAAAATAKGRPAGLQVLELKEACRQPRVDGSLLLLVAPTVSDVALCQQLTCETWAGKGVVMLNADFMGANPAGLGVPSELLSYVEQVLTVYCVMPIAVKGLLGRKEGVLLRKVTTKGSDTAPWRIVMPDPGKQDQWLQIAQSKKRPCSEDIQFAFVNANAAQSPLTKLVSSIKGKDKK